MFRYFLFYFLSPLTSISCSPLQQLVSFPLVTVSHYCFRITGPKPSAGKEYPLVSIRRSSAFSTLVATQPMDSSGSLCSFHRRPSGCSSTRAYLHAHRRRMATPGQHGTWALPEQYSLPHPVDRKSTRL